MLDVLYEIIGSIPEVSTGAFIALCLVSFSTSVISAAFGLGGGVTLLTIIAFLLPPLAIIPIHGVIQMSSDLSRALMMWRNIKFTWIIPFLLGSMVGAAVGVSGNFLDRVEALKKAKVDIITIDTAHGHTKSVIDAIREIKSSTSTSKLFFSFKIIGTAFAPLYLIIDL